MTTPTLCDIYKGEDYLSIQKKFWEHIISTCKDANIDTHTYKKKAEEIIISDSIENKEEMEAEKTMYAILSGIDIDEKEQTLSITQGNITTKIESVSQLRNFIEKENIDVGIIFGELGIEHTEDTFFDEYTYQKGKNDSKQDSSTKNTSFKYTWRRGRT